MQLGLEVNVDQDVSPDKGLGEISRGPKVAKTYGKQREPYQIRHAITWIHFLQYVEKAEWWPGMAQNGLKVAVNVGPEIQKPTKLRMREYLAT